MSGVTLNDLFWAAFREERRNHERLVREARRYSLKISRQFASRLPDDLHEEIFDEAFAQLWQMPDRLSGERTPLELFRCAVLLAIRAVRVSYTPPGQRTRPIKGVAYGPIAAEHVGQIADVAMIEACSVGEGVERTLDFDRLPSPEGRKAEERMEHRSEAAAILRLSSPIVARALERIYLHDEPVAAVAGSCAISRFALNRQIGAFAKSWRAAA